MLTDLLDGSGYIEDLEYETPSPTASVASLDAQSPSTYVHSPSEGLSPKSHLFSYAPYPPPTGMDERAMMSHHRRRR